MAAGSTVGARVGIGLALAGGLLAGPFAVPAVAQCELSEHVMVSPSTARPGESVTVVGNNFTEGCTDGTNTVRPARSVSVVFNQGDKEAQLALVNSGPAPNYAFSVKVAIPTGATAGPANLSARSAAAIFTVAEGGPVAKPSDEPGNAGGAPLPGTGSNSSALAAMAAGLLVTGVGCVIAALRAQSTNA